MTKSGLLPVVVALTLAACGANEPAADPAPVATAAPTPAPAAATAFDPVGLYDFEATLGFETRTGTLELVRNEQGALQGEAWLEGESDPAMIESGAVNGNHVSLFALVGGGNQVTFELDFTGATFEGTIDAGGETIEVSGTRRAQ